MRRGTPRALAGPALGLLLLVACPDPEPTWSLLAEPFGQAVLLAAWSDGEEALIVGGDLRGGAGALLRYDGRRLCAEPAPTEHPLWWIHGPRPGAWYAVGGHGTVLREVDGVRSREDLPTRATLFGVWAEGETVLAVGGDPLAGTGEVWERRDGTWAPLALDLEGPLFKVWRDWIVGQGVTWRLEGDALVAYPPPGAPTLTTVRGRGPEDVWAVGGDHVLHWTGDGWSRVDAPTGRPLQGVWTAPGEPVWIAGAFGLQGWGDQEGWEVSAPPVTGDSFHAVWPHGDELLFLGGDLFGTGGGHGTIGRWGPGERRLEPEPCGGPRG